ncbi:hypothetical protein BJY16_007056 [Actinoplanes octamycinicus]|uniref:Uncharacterized protein n=1 Tax=Actinoplanes octamycinicus TaxID=135948 RepID=A0A7W7MB22_9ACTN|nr:hypothetical protein [Actinoplanes octamycinicus]MBB4743597.1 hypothetical protein [Actinoplanes octamycinicus]GIE61022.1 hypothetical protein Aoc01nite_64240 [Actinoplanes octamycinicus]
MKTLTQVSYPRSLFHTSATATVDCLSGYASKLDVLALVRVDWKTKGYTITDDRTLDTDRGVLAGETTDGYKLDIETGTPDGFAVIINSPCFERP